MKGIKLEKASELAHKIISLGQKEHFSFNGSGDFPDAIVPKGFEQGSKEHALFLLHAISSDGMTRATKAYQIMRNLFESYGGNIQKFINSNKEKISEVIDIEGTNLIDIPGVIEFNNHYLKDLYNGDPRNIKKESVNETIKAIKKLKQYGDGKSALLMKNFVRFGIWDFSEYEIPIKVDRHAMRISLGSGVVDGEVYGKHIVPGISMPKQLEGTLENMVLRKIIKEEDLKNGRIIIAYQKDLLKPLQKAYMHITSKEKISAIELDDLFWTLGSNLCSVNSYKACKTNCNVGCSLRPPSDSKANWFFIDMDKRNETTQYVLPFEDFYSKDI